MIRAVVVSLTLMPKGVEHPCRCRCAYASCRVSLTLMPKGVEHIQRGKLTAWRHMCRRR